MAGTFFKLSSLPGTTDATLQVGRGDWGDCWGLLEPGWNLGCFGRDLTRKCARTRNRRVRITAKQATHRLPRMMELAARQVDEVLVGFVFNILCSFLILVLV
jgi:hypothetical protein